MCGQVQPQLMTNAIRRHDKELNDITTVPRRQQMEKKNK